MLVQILNANSKYNLFNLRYRVRNQDVNETRVLKFSPQRANWLKELNFRDIILGAYEKLHLVASCITLFHKNNSTEGLGRFRGITTTLEKTAEIF